MKFNTNSILILFGIVAFAIMACFPVTLMAMPLLKPGQPDSNSASATVQAIVTQTMAAATQNAPTTIPATATPVPATNTPVPPTASQTPLPTAVSYCDWVKFVKDVTIPDGTQISIGQVFTKTWRLQNRGTCTWTPDYMLVFTRGDSMGGTTAVRLPGYIAPGQTVDISIALSAPASVGTYTGYWMLRNPSGALFGAGSKANEAFYVVIKTKIDSPYGVITGHLAYPSEFIPAMRVAAFNLNNGKVYFIDTAKGQGSYSINVPVGSYYVVSYPYEGIAGHTDQTDYSNLTGGPLAGGYTQMVPCGLAYGCNDHTFLTVIVMAGQVVVADPLDWYAPVGAFPPLPNP